MTEQYPQQPDRHTFPPAMPPQPPTIPPAPTPKGRLYAIAGAGAVLMAGTGALAGYLAAPRTIVAEDAGPQVTITVTASVDRISPALPADTSAAPTPSASPEAIAAPTPSPECTSFKELTDRDFKLMVKEFGAHYGECYKVHGYVTQSDSSTGAASVRANACGEKHQPQYGFISDCDTNSFFTDTTTDSKTGIKNIVDGDAFTANVRVAMPITYSTTMGGSLTAPAFTLFKITKYADVK
ncbi:hypothetical protein ACODT5_32760 [Streptomyces sp. 5.8]|uniref:hypothetical protein n=1 Tax=Streptomyces sp. 5.8 TaxID=3406571 RepID=UPI003BB6266E